MQTLFYPSQFGDRFTYRIPENLLDKIKPGVRVTVPFGNRNLYSGIVITTHDREPDVRNLRSIIEVPDLVPAINENQLRLWLWISEYYLCSEGEVMKAALPSETSLESYRPKVETYIGLAREFSDEELNEILDKLAKAPRQQELLAAYISLTGYTAGVPVKPVSKQLLLSSAKSTHVYC